MDTINSSNITTHSDVLSRNRGRRITKSLTILNVVLFILALLVTFPFVMVDFIAMSDTWLTSNFGALKQVSGQILLQIPVFNAVYTISYMVLYLYEIIALVSLISQKSYSKILLSIVPALILIISIVFPVTIMGTYNGGSDFPGAGFTTQGLIVYIILNVIYAAVIYVTVGFICKNKDVKQLFVSDKVKYQRMRSEMNDAVADEEVAPEVSPVEESVVK